MPRSSDPGFGSTPPDFQHPQGRAWPFVPRLRLFADTVLVDAGPSADESEIVTAAATLTFDYDGTHLRASDPRMRFFRTTPSGPLAVARDTAAELEARRLLESFGVVEVGCLDGVGTSGLADYVVDPEGDVHAICTFGAYAVPQLRSRGWTVEFEPEYPWQTVDAARGWYADVQDGDEQGWFSFELGIEVDGGRMNLMPLLLDLLERAPAGLELESLAKSCRRFLGLPLVRNRYLAIEPERLRAILRVLLELHQDREGARSRACDLQRAALAHLDDVFSAGTLAWSGTGERQLRRAPAAPRRDIPAIPTGLCATLRPYQREGVAWMQDLAERGVGGVLADDMGLGKTLQIIAHLVLERDAGRLDEPALVVTPTSLVGNWQRELMRFAPSLQVLTVHGPTRRSSWREVGCYDVVLTTYPVLLRDQDLLDAASFSLAVLDEAQAIKNVRSQIHRAVRRVRAHRRLCLSGTPLENNLGELWALFDFVTPGLLGSATVFRDAFAAPIEKGESEDRLAALRARIAPFLLRRTKAAVAPELPPKTEIVRPIDLYGAQRDLYESIRLAAHERVRQAVRERGLARSTIDILDALMKLRQACCDPRLVRLDAAQRVPESAKLEVLLDIVTTQLTQGHRALVFSQFTSMLALIGRELSTRGIRHAVLTGATGDRQAQVDAFEARRVDVFLISLKAGGTGLNLTSADTVVHYDPWWNPAAQAQATDRAYRIGQTRPVFVYNLIVAGSVEERIMNLQQRKRDLADSLLAGATQGAQVFSQDDVETLLAPLDDEAGAAVHPARAGTHGPTHACETVLASTPAVGSTASRAPGERRFVAATAARRGRERG